MASSTEFSWTAFALYGYGAATGGLVEAEQGEGKLASAGAELAGDAKYLALVQLEADILEAGGGEVVHLHHHVFALGYGFLAAAGFEFAAGL